MSNWKFNPNNVDHLKDRIAAIEADDAGKPVEFMRESTGEWEGLGPNGPAWVPDYRYRPAPESVTRPWLSPEDVPSPCWLKSSTCKTGEAFLVIIILSGGIGVHSRGCIPWAELGRSDLWEFSTDRREWKACTITEPAP